MSDLNARTIRDSLLFDAIGAQSDTHSTTPKGSFTKATSNVLSNNNTREGGRFVKKQDNMLNMSIASIASGSIDADEVSENDLQPTPQQKTRLLSSLKDARVEKAKPATKVGAGVGVGAGVVVVGGLTAWAFIQNSMIIGATVTGIAGSIGGPWGTVAGAAVGAVAGLVVGGIIAGIGYLIGKAVGYSKSNKFSSYEDIKQQFSAMPMGPKNRPGKLFQEVAKTVDPESKIDASRDFSGRLNRLDVDHLTVPQRQRIQQRFERTVDHIARHSRRVSDTDLKAVMKQLIEMERDFPTEGDQDFLDELIDRHDRKVKAQDYPSSPLRITHGRAQMQSIVRQRTGLMDDYRAVATKLVDTIAEPGGSETWSLDWRVLGEIKHGLETLNAAVNEYQQWNQLAQAPQLAEANDDEIIEFRGEKSVIELTAAKQQRPADNDLLIEPEAGNQQLNDLKTLALDIFGDRVRAKMEQVNSSIDSLQIEAQNSVRIAAYIGEQALHGQAMPPAVQKQFAQLASRAATMGIELTPQNLGNIKLQIDHRLQMPPPIAASPPRTYPSKNELMEAMGPRLAEAKNLWQAAACKANDMLQLSANPNANLEDFLRALGEVDAASQHYVNFIAVNSIKEDVHPQTKELTGWSPRIADRPNDTGPFRLKQPKEVGEVELREMVETVVRDQAPAVFANNKPLLNLNNDHGLMGRNGNLTAFRTALQLFYNTPVLKSDAGSTQFGSEMKALENVVDLVGKSLIQKPVGQQQALPQQLTAEEADRARLEAVDDRTKGITRSIDNRFRNPQFSTRRQHLSNDERQRVIASGANPDQTERMVNALRNVWLERAAMKIPNEALVNQPGGQGVNQLLQQNV